MDNATGNGMSAERCAKLMLKAIRNKKEEVHIAGAKEKFGVFVKRFFPRLFSILIRKMKVT
jgi:dehydrogenase/reductase SDR family protein 7B